MEKLKMLLVKLLMLPLLPLFGWGPVTHPYINFMALKRAEQEAALGNSKINRGLLARIKRQRPRFIFGANSADTIATLHVFTGTPVYDHTHNYVPDCATGRPVFGYALIREWFEARDREARCYPEEDLVVACGWLAHQLADWYSHYAAVNSEGHLGPDPSASPDGQTLFSGYANSHRVLGADFYPEILREYRQIDHALIEFFHDLLITYYDREGIFNTSRVDFFKAYGSGADAYNLLTATSERFRGVAARISPDQLSLLKDNLRTTVKGIRLLIHLLFFLRPGLPDAVYRDVSPNATGGPDYIGLSVEEVLNGLFCKTDAEIAQEARLPYNTPRNICPESCLVREVTTPGTLLFRVAHRLGSFLPEAFSQPYSQSENLSLRFLKFFELRGKLLDRVLAELTLKKLQAFTENTEENAVLSFISMLLTDVHPDFETARARFRTLLPPLVQLGGPTELSEAERLTVMLNASEICVRAIPAAPFNDPNRRVKTLDVSTLRFLLDGYNVLAGTDYCDFTVNENDSRRDIRVRLKEPVSEGYHRLSVTINDFYGVSAKPLERDFWIDVGTTVRIIR
ncbi:MAG: hypothetical protein C4570_06635 [Ammonifex sp.]|jgi:hypothetical protein|nr:MAG: hypothetical protein C4570_06635 [Ammonifex sp.]